MSEVIYRFQELTTGTVIEDLPVSASQGLPRNLSSDADSTLVLPLGDVDVQQLAFKAATTPGRMGVFCIEDGQPMWGGMVWARQFQRSSRQLQITVSTIESYYRRRVLNCTINVTQKDQFAILVYLLTGIWTIGAEWGILNSDGSKSERPTVQQMWVQDYDGTYLSVADCMASVIYPYSAADGTGGNWWNVNESSGVLRDRSWSPGKVVYDAVSELSGVDGGIEWMMDPVVLPTGGLGWMLRMGTPRLGRTYDITGFDWTCTPGWTPQDQSAESDDNIEDYTYAEDARNSANHQINVGAEVNGLPLVSDLADLSLRRAGYPILEQSASYTDVVYQDTLDTHTAGDLASNALPIATTIWTVSTEMSPAFGEYALGDEALFRVSDPLDPMQADGSAGRETIERIVGWVYWPTQAGQRRKIDLITNPTAQTRLKMLPSLKRRLDLLQRQASGQAITPKAPQSNVPVVINNPGYVSVAAGSPAPTTPGPDTIISDLVFIKQADFLHVYMQLGGFGNGTFTSYVDIRDGSVLAGYVSNTYDTTRRIYDDRISLAAWDYGDVVEIEIHEFQAAGPSASAALIRVYYAMQGPK